MKTSNKIAALASVILIGIVSVVSIRTLTFSSKQFSVPAAERVEINENSTIEHLSQGIRIKTVSYDNPSENDSLILLRDYINTQYPLIHVKLQRTIINNYSLLYEWKGTNPGEKPIVLAAHMDVVPAPRPGGEPYRGDALPGSGRQNTGERQ